MKCASAPGIVVEVQWRDLELVDVQVQVEDQLTVTSTYRKDAEIVSAEEPAEEEIELESEEVVPSSPRAPVTINW
jgi:hypothetical protein